MKRDYLGGGGRANRTKIILDTRHNKESNIKFVDCFERNCFPEVISNPLSRGSIFDNRSYLVTLVMKAAF